jgi:hypothetical protein
MVVSPVGLGTKNDCADGDQQQFIRTDLTTELLLYPATEDPSSKWSQRSRGLPPPSFEDGDKSSFRNTLFFRIQDDGQS